MRLGSGAGDRGTRGRQRRLRLREPRLRGVHRVLLVLQRFLRDSVQRDQRPVALDVLVGLRQLHLLGLQRGRIALFLGKQLRHVTHRLGEIGLGLGEGHLRVARIELHQHLAAVHELRLVGFDRRHRAGHLRREPDQVAVDVGVVGADVEARHGQVVQRPAADGEQRHGADDDQRAAVARGGRRRLRGGLVTHACLPG